jgi:hypothetical protein
MCFIVGSRESRVLLPALVMATKERGNTAGEGGGEGANPTRA